jgi:hypothetical protein
VATISSLLADHVSLQVRSVDRLFLQGWVPRLMTEGQVIRFLLDRGFPIPSPVVLGKIGRDYVNRVNQFIVDHEIPTVRFVKGDVKEEIAREHFKRAEREGRYAQQGIAFRALDNGFASCDDPQALAQICHSLSAEDVRLFFERWQGALPSPLTDEDRRRGYAHALAFRQLEISDTRVFDRPAAGRAWFEQTIPDQLTLGRPDQAAVIFGRRVNRRRS